MSTRCFAVDWKHKNRFTQCCLNVCLICETHVPLGHHLKIAMTHRKITTSQPHILVKQAENSGTHCARRCVCLCCIVCFGPMSVGVDGQRDWPTTRSLTTIAVLAQHTCQRTVCALSHLSNARRTPWGLVCLARSGIPSLTPTPQWSSTSSPWKLPLKLSAPRAKPRG